MIPMDAMMKKKKRLSFRFNYNHLNIDTHSYEYIEYSSSALIYLEDKDMNHSKERFFDKILRERDILTEDIFDDIDDRI